MSDVHMTKRGRVAMQVVAGIILIVIWCGVVYFSYNKVKAYYDQSLDTFKGQLQTELDHVREEIKQANAVTETVNGRIRSLGEDMQKLEDEVLLTLIELEKLRETIDQRAESNAELYGQLDQLDERLRELKESLTILQERPNE